MLEPFPGGLFAATMSSLRYAITDRIQYGETEPQRRAGLIAQASRLAAAGIDYIQLREKDLPAQDLIGLARQILSAISASQSGTRLLINSRADIAIAAGADGVHLPSGEDQLKPTQIQAIFGAAGARKATISVSCHSLSEVERAKEDGADMILFGPVFGKSIGDEMVVPGTGLEALRTACEAAEGTAVLALGGVTAANSDQCIAAGAKGIAAIRLFR